MSQPHYAALNVALRSYVDVALLKVEAEFASNTPSEAAFLAISINETLRTAMRTKRRFTQASGDTIISYRHGDLWKYQFAPPMMITRQAAEFLYQGGDPRGKAVNHIDGFKNGQTVMVHGEHVVPSSEQRRQLPNLLIEKDDLGLIDNVKFPHTAYARELLLLNKIVCMHVSESLHLPNSTMPTFTDLWSRYHSYDNHIDILPSIIKRSLCKDGFSAMPESLRPITKGLMKQKPSTFEDFWSMLTE